MLTIAGGYRPYCDRLSRRSFLSAGALGVAGLGLADLMRLEARGGERSRSKSVIYVCLGGGPSHIDTWDMKPHAPSEYRGEFAPIATNVPGVDICELMPLQARIADKLAIVRGVQSVENDHYLAEVYTGMPRAAERPAFGSVISRLMGGRSLPPYVSLNEETTPIFEFENPSYVGAAHRPFRPFGDGLNDLGLLEGIDLARLDDRKRLLGSLDRVRREIDARGEMTGIDGFTRQALEMLASPAAREAFDVSREPDSVREAYGRGMKYEYNRYPSYLWDADLFVLARRLVEAGVRIVTLRPGSWDHHGGEQQGSIFNGYRTQLPAVDRSIHALITDLADRGMLDDVLVVILGEFGRGPRVNEGGGRDHWAEAGCVLFAGGGLKSGLVVGQTDARAERPTTRSIGFQNIVATIYRVLGIDPETTLPDHFGRPQYLLDEREPIAELVG